MTLLAVVGIIVIFVIVVIVRVLGDVIRDVNKWDRRGGSERYHKGRR
jgi:hypothetical protein